MNLTVAKSSAARSLFLVSGSFLCGPHAGVYSCCESVITMTLSCSKDTICSPSPIFCLFHLFCPIFCNVILVLFWIEPSSITYSGHLVKLLQPLSFTGKNLFCLRLRVIFLCAYKYKYFKSKLMTSQFCSVTVFSYIAEHGFSVFWSLTTWGFYIRYPAYLHCAS